MRGLVVDVVVVVVVVVLVVLVVSDAFRKMLKTTSV
jgi:hypothetical protein